MNCGILFSYGDVFIEYYSSCDLLVIFFIGFRSIKGLGTSWEIFVCTVYQSKISDGPTRPEGGGLLTRYGEGIEGGPPSNGPPMLDWGKKCNQCEYTPLQTSHVRKHAKAHQIAQHSSQFPDWVKTCNQCNANLQISNMRRHMKVLPRPTIGQNASFVTSKTG